MLADKSTQKGAVLFIGLVMLTVISLIAVSSMQSSNLQELMATNAQDQMSAFEAAEAAIVEAENLLENGVITLGDFSDGDTSDGLFELMYDQAWEEVDWENDSIQVAGIEGVNSAPRFVIQHLGAVMSDGANRNVNIDNAYNESSSGAIETIAQLYRITARGTGKTDSSVVVLESVYGVTDF